MSKRSPTCLVVPHEWAVGVDLRDDELDPWIALRPGPSRYPWTILRIAPIQIETALLMAERAHQHHDDAKPLPPPSWYYRAALDVPEPLPAISWQIFAKPMGVHVEARGEGSAWARRLIPLDAWRWFRSEVLRAL